MAVEDGKTKKFEADALQKLIRSRHETFAKMMCQCQETDYEIVPIREEAGFTA